MKLYKKIVIAVVLVLAIASGLIALFWGDQEARNSILAGCITALVLAPCGVLASEIFIGN